MKRDQEIESRNPIRARQLGSGDVVGFVTWHVFLVICMYLYICIMHLYILLFLPINSCGG